MYGFSLEKPGHWTVQGVDRMCLYWIPLDSLEDKKAIKNLVPVLVSFLEWVTEEELLCNQNHVIDSLKNNEKEMLRRCSDETYWSFDKGIRNKMKQAGGHIARRPPLIKNGMPEMEPWQRELMAELRPNIKESLRPVNESDLAQWPTVDSVLAELQSDTYEFPEGALAAAIHYKETITPVLLTFLDQFTEVYTNDTQYNNLVYYSIFLLAYFRERQAFPRLISLLTLPPELADSLLGDLICGYDIANILASTFNGDFNLVMGLILNEAADQYARSSGLNLFLALFHTQQISYASLLEYFRLLLDNPLSTQPNVQKFLISMLGTCVLDAHVEELFPEIKQRLIMGEIDHEVFRLNDLSDAIQQAKNKGVEAWRQKAMSSYGFIEDIKESLGSWHCFHQEENQEEEHDYDQFPPMFDDSLWGQDSDESETSNVVPFKRVDDKVGRNSPCPCGSGKKYKKCCLH